MEAEDIRRAADIKDITAEAGVIASVLVSPKLTFFSEQLRPNHFTDAQNACVYHAVVELAKRGVEKVDAYNVMNILNSKAMLQWAQESKTITIDALRELLEAAPMIARSASSDYGILVEKVMEAAFRRDTYNKLVACERMCFNASVENIGQKISSELDSVMMEYASRNEVPQYKDIIDEMWKQIVARQGDGVSGTPFKFPMLNQYVTIEPGELIIFGAEAKQGKSMMLLNCAVDLLKQGLKVLYLDSELNTRLFTNRLISHLTGIEFSRVRTGRYNEDEARKIEKEIAWLKTREFTHLYMPIFDEQSIYSIIKKVNHTQGVDVLIVDYFKSKGEGDAFASYQDLGRIVDFRSQYRVVLKTG